MRKEALGTAPFAGMRKRAQSGRRKCAHVQGMMEYQQIISNLQAAGRSYDPR